MLSSRIDRETKNARQTFSATSRASAFGGERSERKQLERLREKLCSFLKNLCFVFPGKSHSREIELVSERFSDLNSRSLSLSLSEARARERTIASNERTNERKRDDDESDDGNENNETLVVHVGRLDARPSAPLEGRERRGGRGRGAQGNRLLVSSPLSKEKETEEREWVNEAT